MKNKIFLTLLVVSLVGIIFIVKCDANNNLSNKLDTKIKSGNLSTDYTIDKALHDIEKFGLNTVNVPIVINVDEISSSTMRIDSESKERAIKLIKKLKKEKINIILEPYPWIANGSEYETDWNPKDINNFFWNWKNDVLKVLIDDVAVPYSVDVINIGTGFNHMEYAEGYWLDTIDFVRENYNGLVTYRSSWWMTADWDEYTIKDYENKLNNKLFSKLDFISIAAYFELTDNDTNSVENLTNALSSSQVFERNQNIKQEIKNFHDKWNKPIFFGELGFPRTTKASVQPWNPFQSKVANGIEQANCFEAYRNVFKDEPWFMGFSVFAIGEDSQDKLYYPSPESTIVIKDWYNN